MTKNLKILISHRYIEGNHIMDGEVDKIVSDDFAENVALKQLRELNFLQVN